MNVKRLTALVLAMIMLLALSACGNKNETAEPSPTVSPTEAPAPTPTPEPEWEPGIVRASYIGGLLKLLQRGDEVTILGEWEDYFIIQGDDMPLLIEKLFLRSETEGAPEEYQAYAQDQTSVYTTAYLRGESVITLDLNTEVTVLDKKGPWALIQLEDGTEGYVDIENISNEYIVHYSGGGNYGGGGNSGGSSSGGAQDGTDVNLGNISYTTGDASIEMLLSDAPELEYDKYEAPISGVILSAETEVFAYMFMRDTELKVTEVTEATETEEAMCTVWINDLFVTLPRWTLRMEGDEPYQAWTAYGRSGVAYTEIQRWHELMEISTNQEIEVVDELKEIDMYVIKVNDTYGYVNTDNLSTTKYVAQPYSGNSGNSGGGSTGWTPPKL